MRTLVPALLLLLAAGCAHDAPPPEAAAPLAAAPPASHGPAAIRLNGEEVQVRWSDGDSFELKSGSLKGADTRLTGYNTLESYGPVHRFGDWTAAELYGIARSSKELASAEVWDCTGGGEKDSYGRLLISCPGVSRAMIRAGHAFVMAVDEEPDPELLRLQREARAAKAGMWAKGAPAEIVTSVHPAVPGKPGYNRVVDLETGRSRKWTHESAYAICEEVCLPGGGACLVHVPFDRRYKPETKADCLK